MATTEILLLKPVKNLGSEADELRVKSGYARNYLFPMGIALPLTRANKKQIEELRKAREIREKRDLEEAQATAAKLAHAAIAIVVKTGENGKLFGAVSVREVCDHLAQAGIEIDGKKIHLGAPIKEVGRHVASIKLHPEVSVDLWFDVVSENPIG
jgi:large subunit ribosomal protein L9